MSRGREERWADREGKERKGKYEKMETGMILTLYVGEKREMEQPR